MSSQTKCIPFCLRDEKPAMSGVSWFDMCHIPYAPVEAGK